jgi:hypothetical protein
MEISTMRPIFKITDWDGLPDDDWDGLKDNPCWPQHLAPDDPGWALLYEDEFYQDQHPELRPHTASYRLAPDPQSVRDALNALAGNGISTTVQNNRPSWWRPGNGRGQIPNELMGLLPGVPARFTRKFARDLNGNETTVPDDFDDMDQSDSNIIGEEDVSQEEDEQWMRNYHEMLMSFYNYPETSVNTVPSTTEAKPTVQPDSSACSTSTAIAGSVATAEMPKPTSP